MRGGNMHRVLVVGAALILGATPAVAQGRARPLRPLRGLARQGDSDGTRRAALERRFREEGERIVRERLKLTDDQMRQLRDVNARLAPRRNQLFQQQRATQLAIRAELARGGSADQGRVAQLMGEARDLDQQRFRLQQEEQRALATFLTPVQQAQYVGLQQQLRQKVRELRRARGGVDDLPPTP